MSALELEIQGLDKVREYFRTAPARVGGILRRALSSAAALAERAAKEEAPVDTGNLRSGIYTRFSDGQAVIAPLAKYALDVHEGRPPGPITGDERAHLMKWATNHGLNPYAVVKSIEKKGTKANPFMQRAAEGVAPGIMAAFDQAVNEIVEG